VALRGPGERQSQPGLGHDGLSRGQGGRHDHPGEKTTLNRAEPALGLDQPGGTVLLGKKENGRDSGAFFGKRRGQGPDELTLGKRKTGRQR